MSGFNPLEYKSSIKVLISNANKTYSGKGIVILITLSESTKYESSLTIDGISIVGNNPSDKVFPLFYYFKSSCVITGNATGIIYYY